VVIHDDIDLPLGRIKIIEKGGHGGHRGIQSLMQFFGGDRFVRLRIGVGRPEPNVEVTNHVLGKFSATEADHFSETLLRARDAVVSILCTGVRDSMNVFNRKNET